MATAKTTARKTTKTTTGTTAGPSTTALETQVANLEEQVANLTRQVAALSSAKSANTQNNNFATKQQVSNALRKMGAREWVLADSHLQ